MMDLRAKDMTQDVELGQQFGFKLEELLGEFAGTIHAAFDVVGADRTGLASLRLDWEIGDEQAADQVWLVSLLAKQATEDAIELLLDGDTDCHDPLMGALDGIVKQGYGKRTVLLGDSPQAYSRHRPAKQATEYAIYLKLGLTTA